MSMFTLNHCPLDNVQITLIHGPNIPDSYAILFFAALDFTFTIRHIHNWESFLLWPRYFILSGAISNVGGDNGNPLQYSCLENPIDRGAWQATVHRVKRVGHDLATKPPPFPIACWTPTDLEGLTFQCHIFLPFHTVHGVLTARILEWFAISSSSGPWFVRIHYGWSVLEWPCPAWLIASWVAPTPSPGQGCYPWAWNLKDFFIVYIICW